MRRSIPAVLAAVHLMSGMAQAEDLPTPAQLATLSQRFAPVEVKVDLSNLPAQERAALAKLVEASRYVDELFMRQRSAGNDALLFQLLSDQSDLGRARLDYFLLNKGPWSELDEDRAFLPGIGTKPQSGNFYPADATRSGAKVWMPSIHRAFCAGTLCRLL